MLAWIIAALLGVAAVVATVIAVRSGRRLGGQLAAARQRTVELEEASARCRQELEAARAEASRAAEAQRASAAAEQEVRAELRRTERSLTEALAGAELAEAAERRNVELSARLSEMERRWADSERHLSQSTAALREAEQRYQEAEAALAAAGRIDGEDPGAWSHDAEEGLLGLLEHRWRRSWAALVGPSLDLAAPPVAEGLGWPWSAVVSGIAVELESVREEVGTPGTLELGDDGSTPTTYAAAMGLAAGVELVRTAARRADEVVVRASPCRGGVAIGLRAVGGADAVGDLVALAGATGGAATLQASVDEADGHLDATLEVPSRPD